MIQSITISDCVGPYSQCVLKGDILQCIDHAKRLGYEGVEMHMRNAKLNDYHRIKEYSNDYRYLYLSMLKMHPGKSHTYLCTFCNSPY